MFNINFFTVVLHQQKFLTDGLDSDKVEILLVWKALCGVHR